jgi:hypothetical protein
MFGDHTREAASRIAEQISARVQAKCVVLPSKNMPGMFTIGVPVDVFTLQELRSLLPAEDYKRLQGTIFDR